MFRRTVHAALLVDFDNIAAQLGHDNFVGNIPRWLSWLEHGQFDPEERKRSFVIKQMYWNEDGEKYRQAVQKKQRFQALLCPSRVWLKKSAADMTIAVDAVCQSYDSKRIAEYIILAVDCDYEPLIRKLSDRGKRTAIVADANDSTGWRVYSECATTVIPLESFAKALAYQPPRRLGERIKDKLARAKEALSANERRLRLAATCLEEPGKEQPGRPLARKKVMGALKDIRGFETDGPKAYFSCGNYDTMLQQIAERSETLFVHKAPHGAEISWRPPKDPPSPDALPKLLTKKKPPRKRTRRYFGKWRKRRSP